MPTLILATKLYVPPPQSTLVARSRLIALLNEGLQRRLTLISAPAGFGKTTLVSEWVAACGRSVAWLSLDAEDSDPTRFLTYLVFVLRTIAAEVGTRALGALESPRPPPPETILTGLLNDVAASTHSLILVLDDYHVVDSTAVDDALTFLLDHLPPQMHLVITTREDPQLPLARLRARGQLSELRAADLRFTPAEAAEFLNRSMGLSLLAGEVTVLETRTEGWIAGLQLAALSMRGRADVAGFVKAFAGDNRYIVDYLIAEVLQRQPDHVRNFLLQTSLLDRLSGSLCDAVLGMDEETLLSEPSSVVRRPPSAVVLETLERANLFIVPLNNERRWYRYHHLFADVLAARALHEQPVQIPILHQRASDWYAANGLPAAADFARLAVRWSGNSPDAVLLVGGVCNADGVH